MTVGTHVGIFEMRGACMLLAVAAHGAPNATSPLSKLQRLSTLRWASRLDPAASLVVPFLPVFLKTECGLAAHTVGALMGGTQEAEEARC